MRTIGDTPFKRKLSFHATDMVKGRVVVFDETVPIEERIDAIIASTSVASVFPPVEMWAGDEHLDMVDGAVFSRMAIGDPIERCRDDGAADADIIVDSIVPYGNLPDLGKYNARDFLWNNAFTMNQRKREIFEHYRLERDYNRQARAFPDVFFRLSVTPKMPLATLLEGKSRLSVSESFVHKEIDLGYEDGLDAASNLLQFSRVK